MEKSPAEMWDGRFRLISLFSLLNINITFGLNLKINHIRIWYGLLNCCVDRLVDGYNNGNGNGEKMQHSVIC